MALVPRRPHYPLPRLEEKKWRESVGEFGGEIVDYLTRLTTQLYKSYDEIYLAFLKSWYVKYDETNISNPPTDAQLDGIFGSPSIVGKGFTSIVNDAGAGTNEYLVWSDGSNWWHVAGTKAV